MEAVGCLVRIRPLVPREYGYGLVADSVGDGKTVHVRKVTAGKAKVVQSTQADCVLTGDSTQAEVYAHAEGYAVCVLEGVNSTVFAYGQSGTGKTFSMLGKETKGGENKTVIGDKVVDLDYALEGEGSGVIPRAVRDVFDRMDQNGGEFVYRTTCSYLQVYGSQVLDLLKDSAQGARGGKGSSQGGKGKGKGPALQPWSTSLSPVMDVVEDPVWGVNMPSVEQVSVESSAEVFELLASGSKHRTMRQTLYNEQSSRSHLILQLRVERFERLPDGSPNMRKVRRGKLNLVDLAGSERWQADVNSTDEHIREMKAINESLSALSKVFIALTRKTDHVPYRDSKLTRILSDSIGGNSRTLLIATVSPSEINLEETCGTLRFVDTAKRVMLKVKANEEVNGATLLNHYEAELERMRNLLRSMTEGGEGAKLKEMEKKNKQLSAELNQTQIALAKNVQLPVADDAARTSPAKRSPSARRNTVSDPRYSVLAGVDPKYMLNASNGIMSMRELRAAEMAELKEFERRIDERRQRILNEEKMQLEALRRLRANKADIEEEELKERAAENKMRAERAKAGAGGASQRSIPTQSTEGSKYTLRPPPGISASMQQPVVARKDASKSTSLPAKSSSQRELARLQKRKEELAKEEKEQMKVLEELRSKAASLEDEKRQAAEAAEEKRRELEEAEAQSDAKMAELLEAQRQHAAAKEEIEQTKLAEVAALQKDLEEMRVKRDSELAAEREALAAERKRLEEMKEAEVAALQRELEEMRLAREAEMEAEKIAMKEVRAAELAELHAEMEEIQRLRGELAGGKAAEASRPKTAERALLSEHRGGSREERVQRLSAVMMIQKQGRKMLGKIRQRQSLQEEKDHELEALQREIEELRQLKEGMASDVELERQTAEVERMVQMLEAGKSPSASPNQSTPSSSSKSSPVTPSSRSYLPARTDSGLPPRPSRLSVGGDPSSTPPAQRHHSSPSGGSGPTSTVSDASTREQDAMREEHFGLSHSERLLRVSAILKIQQRFRSKLQDIRARKVAEAEATLRGHYATGARERIKRIKTIVKVQRAFRRRHGFLSPARGSPGVRRT